MSSQSQRGTVEIESIEVPYFDLRAEPGEIARERLDQFVQEIARAPAPGASRLRGLAIMTPQPSDGLALSLAARGIMLIVGRAADPLSSLMDRLRHQLAVIRSAATSGSPSASAPTALANASVPMGGPRSESPYAQPPPGFDPAAFEERMRLLQQPWREEDAWKSDT
jgi:hypothetical protein